MAKRRLKKGPKRFIMVVIFIIATFVILEASEYYYAFNKELTPIEIHENEYYKASDFGIVTVKSTYDYDKDGVDDYTDILNGSKKVAEENPAYVNKYYAGGYPPNGEGTCADVIWRSLKEAGYLLKDMMAKDIRNRFDEYPGVDIIDDNIDFRRVNNIEVFLEKYATSLTTDIYDIEEFQPGDIIIFGDSEHIAMVSDKKNANGVSYIIQNSDEEQTEKEEDVLEIADMSVTKHYRFTYNDKLQELINNM